MNKKYTNSVFSLLFLSESSITQCERFFSMPVKFLSMICASKRPQNESKQWLVRHQPGCLEAGNNYVKVWWSEWAPFFTVSAAGGISVWHVRESLSLPLLVYPCFQCICTHSSWFTPYKSAIRQGLTCFTHVGVVEPSGQQVLYSDSRPSAYLYS